MKARLLAAWMGLFCRHAKVRFIQGTIGSITNEGGRRVTSDREFGVLVHEGDRMKATVCQSCGRLVKWEIESRQENQEESRRRVEKPEVED